MRINSICLAFLCLLFFQLKGQQAQIEASYNPRQTFLEQSLSQTELMAFEKRASEKVNEFYQYLALVCDKKLDIKIRTQAKKQSLELFTGTENKVNGIVLSKFLDSCMSGKLQVATDVKDSKLSANFAEDEKNSVEYKSVVSFALADGKQKKTATVILQRREKQFGKELKTVWVVLIKEIM